MTSARERENGSRGIKKVRYSVENEEVEQLKVEDGEGNAMAGARTTPSSKVDLWSKSALEAQLETPRVGGKGFASSKVAPYMPLGTPDVKRDRSLLPKEFKFYHSYSVEVEEANTIEGVPDDMEPLVLPTRLKGCYWNGERWCGTPFLPRLASACNGFEFLRQEIGKSHKHLIACRMGKYFMKGVNMMETKLQTDKEKIISKSLKRPSIPRLNLRVIPAFQYSDQLAKNAALIFAYRNEAKRLSSTRSTAVTSRCLYQNGEIVSQIKSPTERAHNTIPAKAVEDTSLRQLSNILDKETRFTAVQEKLNSHLKQVVRAIDSVRPFSYTCQYSSLQVLFTPMRGKD